MNCFECAVSGEAQSAVAVCPTCGAGLCLKHLAEAQSYRVGGTVFGCSHDLRRAAVPEGVAVRPAAAANGRGQVVPGSVR